MQDCYGEKLLFYDPVFQHLTAAQTKAMWKMLCIGSESLSIAFNDIVAEEHEGSAKWTATYVFPRSGKWVQNKVHSTFTFEEGKIVNHRDDFNFYHWARQAFGFKGLHLGWTPFFRNQVRLSVAKSLHKFMDSEMASKT